MRAHLPSIVLIAAALSPFAAAAVAAAPSAGSATTRTSSVPADRSDAPSLEQKCRALADAWRDRLDAEKMTVVISPPFVVAGDGGKDRLDGYVDHTIRASEAALQKQFFDRRPAEPVLVLLFESAEPYTRLAKQWFDDREVSPYGYFRRDGVMLMNVGTGTGTLVHELTHALIKPDCPDVPDWFNEGLGSLFEQCTLAGGTIRGLTNWRLAGLQRAIRADALRPLPELIDDDHFYAESRVGLNYAQARYLLMYLQEKGQLEAFYERLREGRANDPSGIRALRESIDPKPLEEFDGEWRKWVLGLRFP